jgi:DNA-binding CsgD family transcriptional regulator
MKPAILPEGTQLMGTSNGVPHLTSRQNDVVKLISEDLSASKIAERLGISRKTLEYHRALIKERLGVEGTAGIVRYAIRTGLIEP